MKKVLFTLVCMFAIFATSVKADNERIIPVNKLPETSQKFIKAHFPEHKVAVAKVETDFLEKVYEVIFTDGQRVEFYRNGEWKEVNCKFGEVPAAIVPAAIKKYVKENYPDAQIWVLELDKSDKEYEIKLSNRWELKFDLQGNLTHLDND